MSHTDKHIIELSFTSDISYQDPLHEITLDVVFSFEKNTWRVDAFWDGGSLWRVRFAPKEVGTYTYRTQCSDTTNSSLHNVVGDFQIEADDISPYPTPDLHIDKKTDTLQTAKGKPFFWLADTWWMALSDRLAFDDFKRLVQDRKAKGFNVVLLVAGLYPDMDSFDPRAKNKDGWVWQEDYKTINPLFFHDADKKITYLLSEGITPCIVGAWGYYLLKMSQDKMQKHWEYLIARWGAYPVVWCAAGEATMPYYLSTTPHEDTQQQKKGWSEIVQFIKQKDPFHRPLTIHPTEIGKEQITQANLLDFDLIQASHNGYESVAKGIKLLEKSHQIKPKMPTIMGEINYEGIIHETSAEVQRLSFWSAVLHGSCGFTYGANGIWQVNTKTKPFGASPHGGCWGDTPWESAMQLAGAREIGLAKELLETLPWHQLQPKPHWISPQNNPLTKETPRIAGIEEKLRIVYFYGPLYPWSTPHYTLLHLEAHITYEAYFFNPRIGEKKALGTVTATKQGAWDIPPLPTFEDWVLILEAIFSSKTPHKSTSTLQKLYRKLKKIISS